MADILVALYLSLLVQQAELPGLTPLQVAAEFPMLAGTSISAPAEAATPGFAFSGIGLKGTADNP